MEKKQGLFSEEEIGGVLEELCKRFGALVHITRDDAIGVLNAATRARINETYRKAFAMSAERYVAPAQPGKANNDLTQDTM